jgi:pilus assembly protein Flp/PilA
LLFFPVSGHERRHGEFHLVKKGVNADVTVALTAASRESMNLKKLLKREKKGQGLVEYALILVLVAIVVIAILLILGPQVGSVFSNVVANFNRLGIGGGYTITLNGSFTVNKTGGAGCSYNLTSGSVLVKQGGQPAQGVTVGGTVTVLNGGGAPVFSFPISGTSNASGQASLSGSGGGGCSGASATVNINGGPSTTATVN